MADERSDRRRSGSDGRARWPGFGAGNRRILGGLAQALLEDAGLPGVPAAMGAPDSRERWNAYAEVAGEALRV